jgi:lipopolysaccharide biosynthesis protein
MLFIARQYGSVARNLAVRPDADIPRPRREERVVVPVPGINRAVVQAINVGRSISPDIRAVLVSEDPIEAARIQERWKLQLSDVPLVFVESPYRALVGPLLAYLDVLDHAWPPDKDAPITFVVIPEYVARSWWERILYNQNVNRLRAALLGRRHTVVVAVPYSREEADDDLSSTMKIA